MDFHGFSCLKQTGNIISPILQRLFLLFIAVLEVMINISETIVLIMILNQYFLLAYSLFIILSGKIQKQNENETEYL